MADLSVRRARPGELDAVGALTALAYQVDGPTTDGYAAKLADARSRAHDAELLVAVDAEDRLLGTVTIALAGERFADIARDGELEFRMLAVDPAARRRGVGEALTRAVVERARELGVHRIVLSSMRRMTTAHRIYERLGFRRLPERDWTVPPSTTLITYALDL